ncbi:GtrA family protein [Planktomarina sp.]|nr:GtrA family protein [Planktomarina sp.]
MYSRQIRIFLLVGLLTVSVDFLIYQSLLSLLVSQVVIAKGCGFTGGVICAYFSNRFWTFGTVKHPKLNVIRFGALYSLTLLINVSINSGVLIILNEVLFAEKIAFLLATGTTAVINFLGMKWLVFNLNFGKPKV